VDGCENAKIGSNTLFEAADTVHGYKVLIDRAGQLKSINLKLNIIAR
jgi:hypothetical protein